MNARDEKLPVVGVATMGIACLLSNYGSFWQHYALRRKLRELGFATVRLSRSDDRARFSQAVYNNLYAIAANVKRIVLRRANRNELNRQERAHFKGYWKFRREFGELIAAPAEDWTSRELKAAIAGGDQVFCDCTPVSWLRTVPQGVLKLSYSASTDWLNVLKDKQWLENAATALQVFKAVGVRERLGAVGLNNALEQSVPAESVPDPVLLLKRDEWNELAIPARFDGGGAFLFVYLVNIRSYEEFNLAKLEKIAASLGVGLKICGIQGTAQFIPDQYRVVPSPTEFLALVKNAAYVLTNSFHGTVFAALFSRRFAAIRQPANRASGNVRIEEFLADLDLSARYLAPDESTENIVSMLSRSYDQSAINVELEAMSNRGSSWLADKLKT